MFSLDSPRYRRNVGQAVSRLFRSSFADYTKVGLLRLCGAVWAVGKRRGLLVPGRFIDLSSEVSWNLIYFYRIF